MRPVIITKEGLGDIRQEAQVIAELINTYSCRVHVRKKNCPFSEIDKLCCELVGLTAPSFITLHEHPDLVSKYSLGGYHDKISRVLEHRDVLAANTLVSVSCHSFAEVDYTRNEGLSYVFLSPIFDSISKQGYKAAFERSELRSYLLSHSGSATQVLALGGVDATNIKEVYKLGFVGGALLGTIWQAEGCEVKQYGEILKQIENEK